MKTKNSPVKKNNRRKKALWRLENKDYQSERYANHSAKQLDELKAKDEKEIEILKSKIIDNDKAISIRTKKDRSKQERKVK